MAERPLIERIPTWVRVALVFLTLYAFLVGIGAMGASFKMMGKGFTEALLGTDAGPLVSLFVGILATTLVQSSSTSTSIVVGMVAAGVIPLHSAVFMVMGANMGTTVTNTIVSLGHITRSDEFRRAFAAATVHDFFNILVLLILFPLEVATGFLLKASIYATEVFRGAGGMKLANPITSSTSFSPAGSSVAMFCDASEEKRIGLVKGAGGVTCSKRPKLAVLPSVARSKMSKPRSLQLVQS